MAYLIPVCSAGPTQTIGSRSCAVAPPDKGSRIMPLRIRGAIDCDVHPAVPTVKALLPYMDEYWQETIVARGIDGFNMGSYPPNAPISSRPDLRQADGKAGTDFAQFRRQALDAFDARYAICNCLYGGQIAVSETMSAAMCTAVNDW